MKICKKFAVFFGAQISILSAGTVTTSPSAPTTGLISSSPAGGTDTALFDEDANANHARGQIFSLPDGPGNTFEITALTIKKSTNQTYTNDTLTLRIFEGTQAQWDSGTGHSTATDGSNYYVDTTVTPLHTETFNLNGTYTNDHYLTFQLTTPITVNENSDFGFVMTYDRSSPAHPDRFRHRENGSGGGRIAITTSNHGTSSSRRVVFFLHGTSSFVDPVTISPTAPTTDILATQTLGTIGTNLFSIGANANHARGQLFSLGESSGTSFKINSVTIQKNTEQTFTNDNITLRIFQGTQTQWDSGIGRIASNQDYYSGTTATPLYTELFTLNATIAAQNFVTFELATPLTVSENSDYGFFLTYEPGDGTETAFSHREGTLGGRIAIDASSHTTSTRSMNFFVQGTALTPPEVLELATPFSDDMVLQRDKPIKIWGTANPNAAVNATINGQMGSGTADAQGKWLLEIPALSAGGPHPLTVTSGSKSVILNDVLIGDVWLVFGQSNMVRPLSEMTNSQFYIDEIETNNAPIRCLKVTQFGALTAQEQSTVPSGHYVSGGMNWLNPSSSQSWTSVGTVFAYRMYKATGVPTAIVWAAWGSSSIEGWLPSELSTRLPHFAELLPDYDQVGQAGIVSSRATSAGYSSNTAYLNDLFTNGWTGATSNPDIFVRTRSNVIYNQMIHPLRNLGISGFVWYQGEANAGSTASAAQYAVTLPLFIQEYRSRFNQGNLPFLGVQLPSHNATNWPWFREAQSQMETLPNAFTAITIDTGLSGNIHPFDKEPIGIRLSLLARKYQQGENIEAHGPRFSSMSVTGNEATITFTNASGMNSNTSAALFQIAGPGNNPTFFNANNISVSGNQVTISSSSVSTPTEVRYAWIPVPNALNTLKNDSGIPAAPFRTDSFALPGLAAQAPESINDAYETPRDQTLTIPATGVLENDFDLNQNTLTSHLVNDVSFGTLTLQPNGSFTYTPMEGFAGTDSFTYRGSDGSLESQLATVTITVTGQSSNYYAWRNTISWGVGDDETSAGDPDGDDITNFIEFAFGLDPLTPSNFGLPSFTTNGADTSYHFNNAQPGLTYEVLLSSDLETWSDPPFATLTSADTTPVTIPESQTTNGKLFIRLRISE